jgi:hypothetical protein
VWSEIDQNKGMRLESQQSQRDSDEKTIKGNCVVIITYPKAKAWWSENDQRQSYEYHKAIKGNDTIMRMRPNGRWSKSDQRRRNDDQKRSTAKV